VVFVVDQVALFPVAAVEEREGGRRGGREGGE